MTNKEIIQAVAQKNGGLKELARKVGCSVSELYRIMNGSRKGTSIMLKIVMMYPEYLYDYLGGFKDV